MPTGIVDGVWKGLYGVREHLYIILLFSFVIV